METGNLKTFAEELKKLRESQNVTLQQIKIRTRIDLKYLEAIEEGDFEIMPSVYMRAFIREYAECVGLNGAETLKNYDIAKEGKRSFEPRLTSDQVEEENETPAFNDAAAAEPPVPSQRNSAVNQPWFIPSVAAAAVIIIGIIIYFAFFSGSDELIVSEKPYEEMIEQNKQRYEIIEKENTPPPKTNKVIAERGKKYSLKIIAEDTSWVQVTLDSDSTTDFILFPNRSKTFTSGKDFDLIIGNSGGVKLIFNSDTLNFKGKKNKVKHLLVNESGIKLLPMKEKKAE